MAQQEEPLYDFPEPAQPSAQRRFPGQRGRGSLRSISVLDRLLLTVPVWLQLLINPATALHILQREPPGTFLVRKSRTSQRNVLCVRLADDSVPSFVQQFGIREEHSTLALETSAISFPDLPRLISFYCVSRDVLPFPLELPEAIAKATSHKELESISHMGVEFWSSHLNVRGPREAQKPQNEKKPEAVSSAPPTAPPPPPPPPPPPTSSASTPQTDSDLRLQTSAPEREPTAQKSAPTLFHQFCPITTRSPRELDCGSGLGALCFINPLFLQSQTALSRRRMFKRSLKIRVSMETSTMLSPPLAPPPPPPLMPKTKRRCKGQGVSQPSQGSGQTCGPPAQTVLPLTQLRSSGNQRQQLPPAAPQTQTQGDEVTAQQPIGSMETVPEESDYMQPTPVISYSLPPSLSPYLSPAVSSMAPPLFPKVSPSLSPHSSPALSPSLSPYQSPSLSPYQSPSLSPKAPLSLSPFTSSSPFSPLTEEAPHTPAPPSRPDQQRPEGDAEGGGAGADGNKEEEEEQVEEQEEEEEAALVLQMVAASLSDTDSCSSFSSLEEAAETHSPTTKD